MDIHLLYTFLLSIIPVGELRVSIPYGIAHQLNPALVFTLSVLGNMIPVFFLVWLLPWFERIVSHSQMLDQKSSNFKDRIVVKKFISSYLFFKNRAQKKHTKQFNRFGAFALVFFVGLPLPLTGAWTGALAAYLFGISKKYTIALIFIGVMAAGLIVLGASMGFKAYFL